MALSIPPHEDTEFNSYVSRPVYVRAKQVLMPQYQRLDGRIYASRAAVWIAEAGGQFTQMSDEQFQQQFTREW